MSLVEIKNVTKRYEGSTEPAVDGLTLEVPAGRTVALTLVRPSVQQDTSRHDHALLLPIDQLLTLLHSTTAGSPLITLTFQHNASIFIAIVTNLSR